MAHVLGVQRGQLSFCASSSRTQTRGRCETLCQTQCSQATSRKHTNSKQERSACVGDNQLVECVQCHSKYHHVWRYLCSEWSGRRCQWPGKSVERSTGFEESIDACYEYASSRKEEKGRDITGTTGQDENEEREERGILREL